MLEIRRKINEEYEAAWGTGSREQLRSEEEQRQETPSKEEADGDAWAPGEQDQGESDPDTPLKYP